MLNTTLASDNPLSFRNNLLDRILKLIMAIDDKIRDEKLKYNGKQRRSKNISNIYWVKLKKKKKNILQAKKY